MNWRVPGDLVVQVQQRRRQKREEKAADNGVGDNSLTTGNDVITNKETINCDKIVNATAGWCSDISKMINLIANFTNVMRQRYPHNLLIIQ